MNEEDTDTTEYQVGISQCPISIDESVLFLPPGQSDYNENKNIQRQSYSLNTGNNFDNNFLLNVDHEEHEINSVPMVVNCSITKNGNMVMLPVEEVDFSQLHYVKEEIVSSEDVYDYTSEENNESVTVSHANELSIHNHFVHDDLYRLKNTVMNEKLNNKRSVESNELMSTAKKSKAAFITRTEITKNNKSQYPPLQLTDEERKVAQKEGIVLPTNYPLTKTQERELKRIRRKIRNKISAQDSRRRRKEYVDSLEDKMKSANEYQGNLVEKLRELELENSALKNEVKVLQAALSRVSSSSSVAQNTHSLSPQLHHQMSGQSNVCLLLLMMSSLAFLMSSSVKNVTRSTLLNKDEPDDNTNTSKTEEDLLDCETSNDLTNSLVNSEEITTTAVTTEDIVTDFLQRLQQNPSPNGKTTTNSHNDIFNALKQMHPHELLREHDYFKLMQAESESKVAADGKSSSTSVPSSMATGTWPVEAVTSNSLIKMVSELKNVPSIAHLFGQLFKSDNFLHSFEQIKNTMHS